MKLSFIDELAGEIIIDYDESWMKNLFETTGLEFGDRYGDFTGKLLFDYEDKFKSTRLHRVEYNGWQLTLSKYVDKFSGEFVTRLKIIGNPAKIFYSGKNYDNISFDAFKGILINFSNSLCLPLDQIKVTVPTEPSTTTYLNFDLTAESIRGRFKTFQDKVFTDMVNNRGEVMGYRAKNTHYGFKAYLPSLKFGKPINSIRIEGSYNRTKSFVLPTGVRTWADLLTDEGMYKCFHCVLSKWDDTIIFDPTLKRNRYYADHLNEMILKGRNPRYWLDEFPQTASDKTRKNRLNEYRKLSFEKGEGLHTRIRNSMVIQGEEFRNVTSWLTCNNSELYNNMNLDKEIINKGVPGIRKEESELLINRDINSLEDTSQLLINNTGTLESKRYCNSCKKDISHQKPGSIFCSKKYVGDKAAKHCRNEKSNKKNNLIRKQRRLEAVITASPSIPATETIPIVKSRFRIFWEKYKMKTEGQPYS